MRINSLSCFNNLNFKNLLSTNQGNKLVGLVQKAKELQGVQDGYRIVKLYTPSLPTNEKDDCGTGKMGSKEASNFYDMAKTYYDANAVKHMPYGELTDKQEYNNYGYPCAYLRSSLSVGAETINLADLATNDWGKILDRASVDEFVSTHKKNGKNTSLVDFKTTLGYENQENYPVNKYLKIAFSNFKNNPNPSPNLIQLRKEFEQFKNQKYPVDYDDIYTRLALFPYIKDINARVHFFEGYDSNPNIRAQKQPEYNRLKEKYKNEIEFYKFKQFIAHKTIEKDTKLLHSKGLDSIIDSPFGFSWPEVQSFPDAFIKNAETGFGLPVLNFYDLIYKENSPAHQVLRNKIANCLVYHDGIRLDIGWQYIAPGFKDTNGKWEKLNAGNTITNFIEKTAYEIKGPDYDQRKIMYECDAAAHDFDLWTYKQALDNMKGLAILSTEEEHNDGVGHGSLAFYEYTIGLLKDKMMLGTNNHDKDGVWNCANDKLKYDKHVGALMRVFNHMGIDDWKLFKDDNNWFSHIVKYAVARFAEIACAKHNFILFTDLLGRYEKIDYHSGGRGENADKDYKFRLGRNYEEHFYDSLVDSNAYNIAEVEAYRMEMDGSAERHKEIYETLKKYAVYLKHDGGIKTTEQANNSKYADVDIGSLTFDEINNINV